MKKALMMTCHGLQQPKAKALRFVAARPDLIVQRTGVVLKRRTSPRAFPWLPYPFEPCVALSPSRPFEDFSGGVGRPPHHLLTEGFGRGESRFGDVHLTNQLEVPVHPTHPQKSKQQLYRLYKSTNLL